MKKTLCVCDLCQQHEQAGHRWDENFHGGFSMLGPDGINGKVAYPHLCRICRSQIYAAVTLVVEKRKGLCTQT